MAIAPDHLNLTTLCASKNLSAKLRKELSKLIEPIGVELSADLCRLLTQFSTLDLAAFIDYWSKVDATMRSALIAFILTGDDPDGRFLNYLDTSPDCQEAVDLAFAAHIHSLHDLGRSLEKAKQAVDDSKNQELVAMLSETEQAEEALADAQQRLSDIAAHKTDNLGPLREDVQKAISAVGGTRRALKSLAGIAE